MIRVASPSETASLAKYLAQRFMRASSQRAFRKSGCRFCDENARYFSDQSIFMRRTGFHFAEKPRAGQA
jgi:hypothetical protein